MLFVNKPVLGSVLNAVQRTARVTIEDPGSTGEWFYLESSTLEDRELYSSLERNWNSIVGHNSINFALLYVMGGTDNGVWIHYFPTPQIASEYLPGCYRLASWY